MPERKGRPRTLLGFDFGTRNIGVAVGQELTHSTSPLETVPAQNGNPDWNLISRLITAWRPQALVVGIPLHLDDSEQDMTHAARRFANRLKGRYHLPVFEADERLTSLAAESIMNEREGRRRPRTGDDRSHQLAAQLILETFFSQQQDASR